MSCFTLAIIPSRFHLKPQKKRPVLPPAVLVLLEPPSELELVTECRLQCPLRLATVLTRREISDIVGQAINVAA